MKKFIPLFGLFFPLFLFSQEIRPKDSLLQITPDFFNIKKLQKTLLTISSPLDSTEFAETILLRGSDNYGKNVPDFKAVTLNGENYSSDMLNGKVTFINFWFENCQPCIAEFGALNELYNKYKDNQKFQFLSFTWEKKENALRVAQKYGLEYPIISISLDSCRKLINHKIGGYPTNLITDKDGKIKFYINGGPSDPNNASKLKQFVFIPLLKELLGNTE